MNTILLIIVVATFGSSVNPPTPIGHYSSVEACQAAGELVKAGMEEARKADGISGRKAIIIVCTPDSVPAPAR